MKKALRAVLDAIFPNSFTCDLCGIETFNTNICPDCLKSITFNNNTRCPVCGRKYVVDAICTECKANPPLYKKAVSPLVYENGGTALLNKFKDGGGYLSEYFAELLKEQVAALPKFDFITFIPMTKEAQKKRGYNQAELLAKRLSEKIGVPVICALEKINKTEEQKNLSREERAKNLNGSFRLLDKSVKGKTLLLVDDILTTGATADAACKVLLRGGVTAVYFGTVASVENKLIKLVI